MAARAESFDSRPQFFSQSVGLILWDKGGSYSRGSGCVAQHPQLVFSCAHVLYDGSWASSEVSFYPGYDGRDQPSSGGVAMRGIRGWTEYTSAWWTHGDRADETFQWDFSILYSFADIGDAVGRWPEGGPVLNRSDLWKAIVGYPAILDATGSEGFFRQHATPFFSLVARKWEGTDNNYSFTGVTTGRGNSGGPVFVYDEKNNGPYLAGVLVSGDPLGCGVRALDANTSRLADDALRFAGVSLDQLRTFTNKSSLQLPDGAAKFSSRTVNVAGVSSNPRSVKFSLNIATRRRGDLEVYLKSPRGRTRWIAKRQGGGADNLVVKGANYTAAFPGNPNGKWTLYMRDAAKGDLARFRNFSLVVGAR